MKDITGMRFGKLVAVKHAYTVNRKSTWLFRCDCGIEKNIRMDGVVGGTVVSCGCIRRDDATGKKFGRLLPVKFARTGTNNASIWEFACDCGNRIEAILSDVKRGGIKSCGCLRKECGKEKIHFAQETRTTHGMSGTRLYIMFKGMKSRCYNSHTDHYKYYGGRGITICDEWLNDPQMFIDWALSNGYQDCLSIDRIDNNKGYSPDNCRFVEPAEQMRNMTKNVRISVNNSAPKIKSEWARELNVSSGTISNWIKNRIAPFDGTVMIT